MSTQMPATVDNQHIQQLIQHELKELPTLPAVVLGIMQTANDPNTSATNLKELIMTDQAFAARILRLVNSPYYGFSGKITTITHAIVVLGFNTVRNLAASLGVSKGFGVAPAPTALDLNAFWAHSVATACAASVVGRRKSLSAKVLEEVFIGGLLHDLGKLFLDRYLPDQYGNTILFASENNCSIWEAEKECLGISHTEIGKQVAEKWNIPTATTAMIAYHHEPGLSEEYMVSTGIVHAADYLSRKLAIGGAGDSIEPVLSPDIDQWLSFLPNTWDAIELETQNKYAGAAGLLQAMLGK